MNLRLLFALLVFQLSFAQPQHRTCGMEAQMQRIMNDPAKKAAHENLQRQFEAELQRLSTLNFRDVNATLRIPVAVHFPSISNSSSAAVKDCYRAFAQSQINILNADYNGTNADIANWATDSDFFPNTNTGNMDVQFILGTQNHPAGTGLTNGTVAVTFSTDFRNGADSDSTWAGYMNLVVRDEGDNILGYSPLGGAPEDGETVVINTFCFGAGDGCGSYVPSEPYNLGRTLTHELGHFFNLQHTFGPFDEGNGCVSSNTDNIADTPKVGYCSYGCPSAGDVAACANGDAALTMNFMDYVNDACMYMFTAGQAARMQAYYNVISDQFTTTALANEEFLQNQFSLYPNPSKGSFTIEFKDFSNSFAIEVFDVTGKTIYENNYEQSSNLTQVINLDKPSSGVYFVNIKSDKGLVTKKLIIQ